MAQDVRPHNIQSGDYDRDVALTITEFVLSPHIPPSERKYFEKYQIMFSETMALGNIERNDIFIMLLAFDEICMLLEMGLYEEARQLMGREMLKMQASRSVGGFQTLFGQQGIQRVENVQRILRQRSKATLGGRLTRLFKGHEKEEYITEEVQQ